MTMVAKEGRRLMALVSLLMLCVFSLLTMFTEGLGDMGICYGLLGNNLPPPANAIGVLKTCSLKQVRFYDPNPDVLDAFIQAFPPLGPIGVIVGTKNQDLQPLAENPDFAYDWVGNNIVPFSTIPIRGIIAGNEVIPGPLAIYVPGAMRNLRAALDFFDLANIYVSTTLYGSSLANSFPPSASTILEQNNATMAEIVSFMNNVAPSSRGPLFVHIYPYFPYASNPKDISQDYVMFRSPNPVVYDGNFQYYNLFDAMFDSYVWAMEKIGGAGIELAVGETGWPSAGNGDITTPGLASEFNTKLQAHITTGAGTPKTAAAKTGWPKLVMVFSLFNENQKAAGAEQYWGLFYPNLTPSYHTPMCPS